ncbi:hypothetical protein B7O87_04200 [Cylindrospermopsis raciborskii CENA303]|uniref:Uncharacterized protein n=1 Tax=Cylindrospermopsis raciborskii CENA303 TaxID=1170769 RepID=A0A1X4GA17_9CYAN|nr:hypothetical protein B7O87_04200 [Cylindrospermopsis raciborskii CENA303]
MYGVHIWLVEVYLKGVGIVKYKVYWWFVGRFKNDGGLKGIISGSVVRFRKCECFAIALKMETVFFITFIKYC